MRKSPLRLVPVAAVAVLSLAACSSGAAPDAAEGGGSLVFASYGSAYQDAQNEAFLDPWAAESGVTVQNDGPTSYPKIQQMVESGNTIWDVADTEPYFPVANCGTLVEEIDFSDIDTSNFPEGTWSDCSIPIAQYSTMMIVNTKTYDGADAPSTPADFFDLEKYPGTRMVPGWAGAGALEFALLADGVAPEDLYPLDTERAYAKLDTIRDSLTFWNTSSESQQSMEDGSADLWLAWSGRGYEAERNGAEIAPVWQDNLLAWASLSIIKGTKNPEAAQSFIEYAAQAEPQARFAELQPYAPADLSAQPELDELQQKWNVADAEVQQQSVVTDVEWWAENSADAEAEWTAWSTS
ncbi:polyamine ABC transporter substrate-binding protein [Leucobacter sp. UCD-THU]|uniref:ABC transporter substrate-binding protein n=1 Tax=Leucobacter sp. UCD-THU TaxID=1292023 RepID=UPI00045F6AA0|nr:ABC transporter substrate-binding protein [Leucobacter sp. UCD-THU]EYT55268.1 polyamine ABC transporter substrate-binding protein [Leucobacter sp. UCD-THU]